MNSQISNLRFYKPKRVLLEDGRCLFSIDWAKDCLLFTGTYYYIHPIEWHKVRIIIDGNVYILSPLARDNTYEPVNIFWVPVNSQFIGSLVVQYDQAQYPIHLERRKVETPPGEIISMTLCFKDVDLLTVWIKHHLRLNVSYYMIYYNDYLANHDWSKLEAFLAQRPNAHVEIVEWPIRYWFPVNSNCSNTIYQAQGFQHHAQPMAINNCLWNLKLERADLFLLLIDLDEFLVAPPRVLLGYLQDILYFPCMWAKWYNSTDANTKVSLETVVNNFSSGAMICASQPDWAHRKILIRVLSVNLIGIHGLKGEDTISTHKCVPFGFAHLCNLDYNYRPENYDKFSD